MDADVKIKSVKNVIVIDYVCVLVISHVRLLAAWAMATRPSSWTLQVKLLEGVCHSFSTKNYRKKEK